MIRFLKWALAISDPEMAEGERVIRDGLGSFSRGIFYYSGRIILTDRRLMLIPSVMPPIRFIPTMKIREIPVERITKIERSHDIRALTHMRGTVVSVYVEGEHPWHIWTHHLSDWENAVQSLLDSRTTVKRVRRS